ncbi:MAG: chloride channel protein [Xanthobacteraceae bacterium]|nr:chloride channel protein [Xanthobacteraceae bacterium]
MASSDTPAGPDAGAPDSAHSLRALVRASEVGFVLLASLIGVFAGFCVLAMGWATQALHELIFRIDPGQHLSATSDIAPALVLAGPALGGLVFGLASWLVFRKREQPVDPIEANALHGGRMSLTDSLIVAVQTTVSSGVGASVGLEAGYTQASSGLASRIGLLFHVRRADLRLLVGCAAGGAIGAAFDAPLTGAFYAFELILGSYSIAAFVPVMAATFTATVTRRLLDPSLTAADTLTITGLSAADLPSLILLGIACGLAGIAVMRGATLIEAGFRRSRVPVFLRPAIGGLGVGALALYSPAVFSAGHGAVHTFLSVEQTLPQIALILLGKALASSISIGSGFRGGLFFASLLLGVLAGRLFAGGLAILPWELTADPTLYALVGMSALAVSIVGGPMTMTLLALEMTGDLNLTLAVLGAAGAASLVTRRLFGFSFATWRFHLRGENIRSAHDIGWLRELTVGTLMRLEVPQVEADLTVAEARRKYPPGSTNYLVAVEADGSYAGMVPPALLYQEEPPETVRALLRDTERMLLPGTPIRDALGMFDEAESETIAVVADRESRRLVGILSEAHAIRRYGEEVSRRNRELTGE